MLFKLREPFYGSTKLKKSLPIVSVDGLLHKEATPMVDYKYCILTLFFIFTFIVYFT